MRLLAFLLFALAALSPARAGSIETFTGDIFTGKVELDFGGVIFHPANAPAVKMELASVYRVQFDAPAVAQEFKPGVVLRNGVRLAGPWGPFNSPVVKFPNRKLTLPTEEIAWIIYTPFPAELAANVPAGQTGVLLPKGDFFAGTIKGAGAEGVKVFNPIFGLRTFPAAEIHALVLRDAGVPPAQYEIRTADGSLFAADSLAPERTSVFIKHSLYDNLVLNPAEIIDIRAGAHRCRPLAELAARGELHADPADSIQLLPDRGFTMAAKSAVNCVVPPGFTEFAAKVVADENAPPGQRLIFSISIDGQIVARSTPLATGEAAQNLHLALSSVRNLILRVDPVGNADPDLRGRWVQAFFLRR